MMDKVLVTGANGFIGRELVSQLLDAGYDVIATGRKANGPSGELRPSYRYVAMDFTDPFAVHDVFQEFKPDVVVHGGAISQPDTCEKEQWQAYLINVEGTMNVMQNAAEHASHLLFLSTDFIFDGVTGMYREEDQAAPVNYYGRTKLDAEDIISSYEQAWSIIRTVLVYGKTLPGRPDLLGNVKEKLSAGQVYNVVNDQYRTPTLVNDLAAGILMLIQQKLQGVFHIAGEGLITPYDMALGLANQLGLDRKLLHPVPSSYFPAAAARPARTGLNIDKAKLAGYRPHTFAEGLEIAFPKKEIT